MATQRHLRAQGIRGALVGFFELSINSGLLLGYVTSWALSDLPPAQAWRTMLGLGALPPMPESPEGGPLRGRPAPCKMPESPRWLIQSGEPERAKAVLLTVYEAAEAEKVLEHLAAERAGQGGTTAAERWGRVLRPTPAVKQVLIIGVGNSFFQQASGQEAAVYYTPEVLRSAGVSAEHIFSATIGIGVVKVAFIVVAMFLLDRHGRRPLLLISAAGLALCQVLGRSPPLDRAPRRREL
jgi:MFS family permease